MGDAQSDRHHRDDFQSQATIRTCFIPMRSRLGDGEAIICHRGNRENAMRDKLLAAMATIAITQSFLTVLAGKGAIDHPVTTAPALAEDLSKKQQSPNA